MTHATVRRFVQKRPPVVGLTGATAVLGLLALVSALGAAESPAPRVGFLLAIAAAFEVLHGIRRSTAAARREASMGALISMVIALLLINAPYLAGAALLAAMAGFFFVDAVRYGLSAWRETDSSSRRLAVLATLGNLAVTLLLVVWGGVGRESAMAWTVAIAAALRIFGVAWNIAVSPVHAIGDAEETVVAELGFSNSPRVVAMSAEIEASETARASVDRGWILAFVATLFAAPFFQSFVEVRVEPSAGRILLRPYGIRGRLTWGELASSESIRPAGVTGETAVEWMVPMVRR